MLVTTEAIVLNLQRHNDRSHILHTYTAAGGRVNFLVYGAGSKKKSAAPFAPLTLVQITADLRQDRQLPTLKEVHLLSLDYPQPSLVRSSIKMFLAEILYRILRHPMPDDAMFTFLRNSLIVLETSDDLSNFHSSFLVGFAAKLGFAINENEHPELMRVPESRADRQLLLRQLCDYYALHVEDFYYPLSLDVLTEIFD